jgi:predicted metal-dependent phosphoesterase TrpH
LSGRPPLAFRTLPPGAPAFDLQSHSIHSDGELPAAGVVRAAAGAGVELFSLTDHDSVAGVAEAAAAAEQLGLGFIPAVEISTIYDEVADLHILGYRIDTADRVLLSRLADSRRDRETRAARMIEALRELGFAVDEGLLEERTRTGKTVGRPHIAQAVVQHPGNAARLEEEDLAEASAFLVAYLTEGRPAFSPREAPSVAEAIALIHDAGGLAVWAHPFWDVATAQEVLSALSHFRGLGIDGVEAFYVTHTREQTDLLVSHAREQQLITTGSSDFHGPRHRQFNRFRAFQTFGLTPDLGPLLEPG